MGNKNTNLIQLVAIIKSKSNIEKNGRFVPDVDQEHSYQGVLYDYEGMNFGIKFDDFVDDIYKDIANLIIGLGQSISRYIDIPDDDLVEKYNKSSKKLRKLIGTIHIGNVIELQVSKVQFLQNRSEDFCDPCLWRKNCLLYAPFGYGQIDYGDGRHTAQPEIIGTKVISKRRES